jgi:predicted nucleic acid-binding protein
MDASALVKLAVDERESDALRAAGAHWERRASSIVASVELALAVRRAEAPDADRRCRGVMASVEMIELTGAIADRAGVAAPLRALDAIHLASALAIGEELGAFVTYDRRLGRAATAAGLEVLAPGAPTG